MCVRKSSVSLKLLISGGVDFGATSSRFSAHATVADAGMAIRERPSNTARLVILKRDIAVISWSLKSKLHKAWEVCSKHILSLADFRKHGFVWRILQAEARANGAVMPAQEWIGGHFERDGGWQRHPLVRAQAGNFLRPFFQRRIVRVDGQCEAGIVLRIFMAAIKRGIARQRHQLFE